MNLEWHHVIFLYSIISKPMARTYHWSVLYGSVAFVWISAIGVVLPEVLKHKLTEHGCSIHVDEDEGTTSFILATIYFVFSPCIPFLLIIIVYYLTVLALKRSTLRHENNRAMELRNKQNGRVVRMFIIIIMVYFLLTIPYAISNIYGCYVNFVDTLNPNRKIINTLTEILAIPASAHNCVNPIIYARMHRDIRKYLGSVIQGMKRACSRFCKRRNERTPASPLTLSLSTLNNNETAMWKGRIWIDKFTVFLHNIIIDVWSIEFKKQYLRSTKTIYNIALWWWHNDDCNDIELS